MELRTAESKSLIRGKAAKVNSGAGSRSRQSPVPRTQLFFRSFFFLHFFETFSCRGFCFLKWKICTCFGHLKRISSPALFYSVSFESMWANLVSSKLHRGLCFFFFLKKVSLDCTFKEVIENQNRLSAAEMTRKVRLLVIGTVYL